MQKAAGSGDSISSRGYCEVEMTDSIASDRPKSPFGSVGGMPPQQLEHELDDSGDDMSPGPSARVPINKRRVRVVFDADDDD